MQPWNREKSYRRRNTSSATWIMKRWGSSLVVQWLGFWALVLRTWVQSMVRKLGPQRQNKRRGECVELLKRYPGGNRIWVSEVKGNAEDVTWRVIGIQIASKTPGESSRISIQSEKWPTYHSFWRLNRRAGALGKNVCIQVMSCCQELSIYIFLMWTTLWSL